MPLLRLLPSALSELFAQVSISGRLTLADRYGLLATLLEESVSTEELHVVDRILHGLRKGRVQVVDEISSAR